MRTRTGGCLCGAVRYTVHGEPTHVGRCHCTDCRRRSGSTYTIYARWPSEAFELEGEPAAFDGDRFCGVCGSHVGLFEDDGVDLSLGTLDDAPFELVPEAEVWIKRREPWLYAVAGASQHEESRG